MRSTRASRGHRVFSKAELLDGVLASVQLGSDDADSCKHSEAAIVDLPLPKLLKQVGKRVNANQAIASSRLSLATLCTPGTPSLRGLQATCAHRPGCTGPGRLGPQSCQAPSQFD